MLRHVALGGEGFSGTGADRTFMMFCYGRLFFGSAVVVEQIWNIHFGSHLDGRRWDSKHLSYIHL